MLTQTKKILRETTALSTIAKISPFYADRIEAAAQRAKDAAVSRVETAIRFAHEKAYGESPVLEVTGSVTARFKNMEIYKAVQRGRALIRERLLMAELK